MPKAHTLAARAGERVAAAIVATALAAAGCGGPERSTKLTPLFVDMSPASGLDFVHVNGMSGELYFNEMAGGGGALFDFDRDGDLDIFAVQGGALGEGGAGTPGAGGRLFRNELSSSVPPRLRFTDVTAVSGLRADGYGMGVAAGDYDDDGWVDLYILNHGSNQLWRNLGDGTFRDVTAEAGANDTRWSTAATFLDYDRDGLLDLFVVNYVDYRLESHKPCLSQAGAVDYCGPQSFAPAHDLLLRNRGNGTFEDVSRRSGILAEPGSGLGVVGADFDGDGWVDIYVANDLMRNDLWINGGDGTFVNRALVAGCAVDAMGRAQASMGVDAGDVDEDGDLDLFMTHLVNDANTLYRNEANGLWSDATIGSRLGTPSLPFTGFGVRMIDFDNDGRLDLAIANGSVTMIDAQRRALDPLPLRMTNQLFANRGRGLFDEVSHRVPGFARPNVGRGLASGDVDNDGDPDLLIFENNGPARLYINQVGQRSSWIGARLAGGGRGRDMHGASVERMTSAGSRQVRRVQSDGSYASASDPRVLFGLGDDARPQRLRVTWPDGRVEEWHDLAAGRYHELVEGDGSPVSAGAKL